MTTQCNTNACAIVSPLMLRNGTVQVSFEKQFSLSRRQLLPRKKQGNSSKIVVQYFMLSVALAAVLSDSSNPRFVAGWEVGASDARRTHQTTLARLSCWTNGMDA